MVIVIQDTLKKRPKQIKKKREHNEENGFKVMLTFEKTTGKHMQSNRIIQGNYQSNLWTGCFG